MTKFEKYLLIYAAIGVVVRVAGRSVSPNINIETFIATAAVWPFALVSGQSNVPVFPPGPTSTV